MSHRQLTVLKQSSDRVRELQQSEHVRDGGSVLPDRFRDLQLGQPELVGKPVVAFSLFDGIEIGSLKVFNQRECQNGFVVDLLDDRRNLLPAELGCRAKSPLTGDQLESILSWSSPYRYWLEEATRAEAFLELTQLFGFKFLSWLERVPSDLTDRDRFERTFVA